MNFEMTDDQASILDALSRILDPYRTLAASSITDRARYAHDVDAALADGGFLELDMNDPDSRMTAALLVAEVAKLPGAVEVAASLLVRPFVEPKATRPLALVWGDATRPTRFLPQANSALIATDSGVRLLEIASGDVENVESLFAYPVGHLRPCAIARAMALPDACSAVLSHWWRIATTLEIHGALKAASDLTIEHVKQRRQFGQPLGAFQALQHRLAINATSVEAMRWLALRAVDSGSEQDSALAAGYSQQEITRIVYDVHQLSGAMGLTTEYALHRFTYRARLLQSERGGSHAQIEAAVASTWPDPSNGAQLTA
jgi:hypothetical protein